MYNVFKNDFYLTKPAPKWAFTVEFFFTHNIDFDEASTTPEFNTDDKELTAPDGLTDIVKALREKKKGTKELWMEKLQKSVAKFPLPHPSPEASNMLFFQGYHYDTPSRYNQSGSVVVTFNDNINRDIRCILEQLHNYDAYSYRNDPSDRTAIPLLPNFLHFDILLRVYDVEEVNQYDPTDGTDEVTQKGTVKSFFFEECYISKLSADKHTYESKDQLRQVDATIEYQRMTPLYEEVREI